MRIDVLLERARLRVQFLRQYAYRCGQTGRFTNLGPVDPKLEEIFDDLREAYQDGREETQAPPHGSE